MLSLAIELKRRRGVFADRWEARITALGIAVVVGAVLVLALIQIFDLLRHFLTGS